MSKCPKCGCEFHETSFSTIVVDKDIPPQTILFGPGPIDSMPYGDMIPVYEDGRWWIVWAMYSKHRRDKKAESAKSQPMSD